MSGELATRPVMSLSGGQKSRLAFAQMAMIRPNFLIFDEPTNHLDMETIDALAKALEVKKFKVCCIVGRMECYCMFVACRYLHVSCNVINVFVQGGVILVSHDERLVRMLCDELWLCKDGSVRRLQGGLDEYKSLVASELQEQKKT